MKQSKFVNGKDICPGMTLDFKLFGIKQVLKLNEYNGPHKFVLNIIECTDGFKISNTDTCKYRLIGE